MGGGTSEIPDRLNAVFVKDLRQLLRSGEFVKPYLGIHFVTAVAVGLEVGTGQILQDLGGGFPVSGGILFFFLTIVFVVQLPLMQIGTLTSESQSAGNADLLYMAGQTRWKIVWSKMLIGLTLTLLVMTSVLPYLFLRYLTGGIDILGSLVSLLLLFGANLLATAFAVGVSGFRSVLARLFWLVLIVISFFVTDGIMSSLAAPFGSAAAAWHLPVIHGAIGALFLLLSLQLGRATLRVARDHTEPSQIAIVGMMILLTPFAVGMALHYLEKPGGWCIVILLLVITIVADNDSRTLLFRKKT